MIAQSRPPPPTPPPSIAPCFPRVLPTDAANSSDPDAQQVNSPGPPSTPTPTPQPSPPPSPQNSPLFISATEGNEGTALFKMMFCA